jgi:hypothetical protein
VGDLGSYPYPGDAPLARARRIAAAYRSRLLSVSPDICAELDDLCRRWGETWAIPRLARVDPEAWLSAADAADLAHVRPASLHQLRRRGRLAGRQVGNRWEYQGKEVLRVISATRARGSRVASDTFPA